MRTEFSLLLAAMAVHVLFSQDGQGIVGVLRTPLVTTLSGAFIALLVPGLRISMASPTTRTH